MDQMKNVIIRDEMENVRELYLKVILKKNYQKKQELWNGYKLWCEKNINQIKKSIKVQRFHQEKASLTVLSKCFGLTPYSKNKILLWGKMNKF